MTKNYNSYSKEELIELLKKQDKKMKQKKYGLIWDSENVPEQIVLDCNKNFPILERVTEKEIKTDDSNYNLLIEGDNFHTLSVLNYTHNEKIDVIYIDPPYNTGNKDFIYNDEYINKEDGYLHSKWLNFMEKRLKLARNLLTESGVIFISIDDNEYANLKLLCDSIFNEKNYICTFIRKTKSMTGDDGNGLNIQSEYLLCYGKNKSLVKFKGKEKTMKNYKNPDNDPNGDWCSGDPSAKSGGKTTYFPIKNPYTGQIDYPPKGRFWAFSQETLKEYIKTGKIVFKKQKIKRQRGFLFKRYKEKLSSSKEIVGTLCFDSNEYMNQVATKELSYVIEENKFNYPKPVNFIKDLLSFVIKDNSTILDFFAGSGTSFLSVLELKKEFQNINVILCTNNENNICTKITYPRIEKVIKGYNYKGKEKDILYEKELTFTDISKKADIIMDEIKNIILCSQSSYSKIEKTIKNNVIKITGINEITEFKDGLGGNLQYFKTAFIKNSKNTEQLKINLTHKCAEMLCVKENIYNLKEESEDFKIFESNKKDKFLCIYYNFINDSFNNFKTTIKNLSGEKVIYMFSIEDTIDKGLFEDVKNCKIEPIPQKILDIYKKIIRENIKRG